MGKIGKCCCPDEECVAPDVTISGYTIDGSGWVQKFPDFGDDCSSCCWRATFINNSPGDTEINTCDNVCNNGSNSRWIVHRRIRSAALIDVWVSKSVCECDPQPAGSKWFVSSRVRDGIEYFVWWNYGGFFGPVPTCIVPCPPSAATLPTSCQWIAAGQCATDFANWTRTKVFNAYPTGAVSFSNSDILSCLLNTAPNLYDIPCFDGPFEQITTNQSIVRNLIPCVNALNGSQCTGTYNVTTTFTPPTWTITFP